ncbi:MAG: Fe-S cluster assembly protein SufD [Gemmataceae bacterium]|nr:Fe-S cluster assembly protein SufD [Gemmataceae bacterium]
MIDVREEYDTYLTDYATLEQEDAPALLTRLRKAAMDRFTELGFPTLRNEEWRFTSLAPLTKVPFRLAGPERQGPRVRSLDRLLAGTEHGQRIVLVNGHFAADLSRTDGIHVGSLATFLKERPEWVEQHLARYAGYDKYPFNALNTAFLRDGACIHIPQGKTLDEPIHLVYVSLTAGEPTVSHPRALIVAEPGSRATVVESYVGPEGDVYFTNTVTEIVLGEDAGIDHYKVQRESTEAFHIATLQIHMQRAARFSSHLVSLGGSLVRNEANSVLDAEGCECTLNGLAMANDRQLVDNHTRIDHAKAHCSSHELYKQVLNGHARGVFNGKIFVHADAQKTDAKQTNQTLLLSNDAVIDTKPQLEIFADDVKCTHGATVGQLDETAIFYLRSRGIGSDEARSLLTFAFANDIVERIKVRPIRAQLEEVLLASQGLPREEGGEAVA